MSVMTGKEVEWERIDVTSAELQATGERLRRAGFDPVFVQRRGSPVLFRMPRDVTRALHPIEGEHYIVSFKR